METKDAKSADYFTGSDSAMFNQCICFIEQIGIKVSFKQITADSFLPGLSIQNGNIIVNVAALQYPGDILHEAGHIAVVPATDRGSLNAATIAERENHAAEEMMAIAWSYAACLHIGLNPRFVFHEGGYQKGGAYIVDAFAGKKYFGLPMLQWIGLTADEKNADKMGIDPYPHMIKWICD